MNGKNSRTGRSLCAASLTAMTIALAACGGDAAEPAAEKPEVTPNQYAAEVCGALSGWTEDLRTGLEEARDDLAPDKATSDKRQALVEFLDGAVEDTADAAGAIRGAGTPEGAGEFSGALVAAMEKAEESLRGAREDAEKLPTGSRREFARASEDLSKSLRDAGQQVQRELQRTGDIPPGVEKALSEHPDCQAPQAS